MKRGMEGGIDAGDSPLMTDERVNGSIAKQLVQRIARLVHDIPGFFFDGAVGAAAAADAAGGANGGAGGAVSVGVGAGAGASAVRVLSSDDPQAATSDSTASDVAE